jgi:hypothetical protein
VHNHIAGSLPSMGEAPSKESFLAKLEAQRRAFLGEYMCVGRR